VQLLSPLKAGTNGGFTNGGTRILKKEFRPLSALSFCVSRYSNPGVRTAVVNRTAVSELFYVYTEGWVPMRLPPPLPNATPASPQSSRSWANPVSN